MYEQQSYHFCLQTQNVSIINLGFKGLAAIMFPAVACVKVKVKHDYNDKI